LVIISDRDKELQKAVQQVLPKVFHSYYCQHLANNIQTGYGLVCRNLFWNTAKAFIENGFQTAIDKIRNEKNTVYQYIVSISYNSWAQYAFLAPRFGHITSNIAEFFNSS
jgi:hypothetical protein